MKETLQAVRGMNDTLPEDVFYWHQLEQALCDISNSFGYQEIRFPILEKTALFKRSIGEETDIVQKEMYTFEDRNGDSLTLRPEGTAACVRACLQHGLLHNQQQRLWYLGPMFRHERPQKGRYRQFYQFGVETFGYDSIDIELELLSMSYRLWQQLGLMEEASLHINTIGTLEERQQYQQALREYLERHQRSLDDDSLRRLEKNPLRILDTKNPQVQAILHEAPQLMDYLSSVSRSRFEALCEGLHALSIPYHVAPSLVRGLDYYSHTVFEWITDSLGAQGAICAGGRYDGLVAQIGNKEVPAAGFAMGLERLVLLLQAKGNCLADKRCDVYVLVDKTISGASVQLSVDRLRKALPQLSFVVDFSGASVKSQLKRADKTKATHALLFLADEFRQGLIGLKSLRVVGEQQWHRLEALSQELLVAEG